jgi:hypothetical protein
VAGRNRTCALPGFNRALYLLSYSHMELMTRTAVACVVVQATRLPFDPGSAIARQRCSANDRPTWRSFGAGASRVGEENVR